jgi:hypothetical protein
MRVKQYLKILPSMIACLLVIACAGKTTMSGEPYNFTPLQDDYTYAGKINLEFKQPRGLAVLQGKLYVVDSGNHRIAIIGNPDSKTPSTAYFGQIGSSPGELLNPQGIISNGRDRLYVADSGNSRIQVYDAAGGFISEHPIKLSDNPSTVIQDLALLDEDHLVFSLDSVEEKFAHLYSMDLQTGKIQNIKGQITGYLTTSDSGGIYALSRLELYTTKNHDEGKSGKHSIFKLGEGKIDEVGLLPNLYTPNDGLIIEDKLYAVSQTFLTVDSFSLDGKHLGTVYRPEDADDKRSESPYTFTFMAGDQQHLYVSDSKNSAVIILKKT